jgi:bifunctional DNA-binding transcriptional regulator/antitoxin component of YhaV-PrlF toxin-antitoxin module
MNNMTLVTVDQKMRIRLPKAASKRFKLKAKEPLNVEVKENEIRITRPLKIDFSKDPMFRDMIERPMRTKIKVTTELLEKWQEEMYS